MKYYIVHTAYDTVGDDDTPIPDRIDWDGSWLVLAHGDIAIARTGATPQLAEGLEAHYRGMTSREELAAVVPAYMFFALADLDAESGLAGDACMIAARIQYAAALRDAADDDHTRLRVERAEAAYCATLLAVALRETLAGRPLT